MFPKIIVAVGASSVFGKVDSENGFIGRLKKWHECNNLEEHNVYNLGIPGDTTTGMLNRLKNETSIRKPDLIIFSLGSNDTRHVGSIDGPITTNLDQFKQNIEEMISIATEITPNIVMVSPYSIDDSKTRPFKGSKFYYLLDDLTQYVSHIKSICKQKNIPYLDIYNELLQNDYSHYLYEDGLHCNSFGHEKIFKKTKEFLINLYQ